MIEYVELHCSNTPIPSLLLMASLVNKVSQQIRAYMLSLGIRHTPVFNYSMAQVQLSPSVISVHNYQINMLPYYPLTTPMFISFLAKKFQLKNTSISIHY